MPICPRCHNEHNGSKKTCEYCHVVNAPSAGRAQSQSEVDWAEHVDDYIHEQDYLSDGGWVE